MRHRTRKEAHNRSPLGKKTLKWSVAKRCCSWSLGFAEHVDLAGGGRNGGVPPHMSPFLLHSTNFLSRGITSDLIGVQELNLLASQPHKIRPSLIYLNSKRFLPEMTGSSHDLDVSSLRKLHRKS
jgi:hypothetical protein